MCVLWVQYLDQQPKLSVLLFQEFLTLLGTAQTSQQHLLLFLGIPVKDDIVQINPTLIGN